MHLNDLVEYGLRRGIDDDLDYDQQHVQWLIVVKTKAKWELKGLKSTESPRGIRLRVPMRVLRTSNVLPSFSADQAKYVLGLQKTGINRKKQEAFITLMEKAAKECADDVLRMTASFLRKTARHLPEDRRIKGAGIEEFDTIAFAYEEGGTWKLLSDRSAVEAWWKKYLKEELDFYYPEPGLCSLTGKKDVIARVLIPISLPEGDDRSTWASCNADSSTRSYGQEQGEVARIGKTAARVLQRVTNAFISNGGSFRLPGSTRMFVIPGNPEADLAYDAIRPLLNPDPDLEEIYIEAHEKTDRVIWEAAATLYSAPQTGKWAKFPDAPFSLLTVTPNKSRLAVLDYRRSNCLELVESIRQWFEDLSHVDHWTKEIRTSFPITTKWVRRREAGKPIPPNEKPRPLRGLLDALLTHSEKKDPSKFPSILAAEVQAAAIDRTRSIPTVLLHRILDRINANLHDSDRSGLAMDIEHMALLKAIINRELRRPTSSLFGSSTSRFKELLPMLDETLKEPSYVRGRMVAFDQRVQRHSIPHVVNSVVSSMLESACKTPQIGMPRIYENITVHLDKIRKRKGWEGFWRWLSEMFYQINALLPSDPKRAFPQITSPLDQVMFYKGYYDEQARKLPTWKELTAEVVAEEPLEPVEANS